MAGVVYNITPEQFARYVRSLGDRYMKAAKRGVLSGALRCVPELRKRTDTAPPASDNGAVGAVNTGRLRAGWRAVATSDGARLFDSQPYAGVVDGGRRPAPVSRQGIEALTAWAKRRLQLSNEEARAAAFAIAVTLRRRALRPRRVMTGGIDTFVELVLKEVERELEAELQRMPT